MPALEQQYVHFNMRATGVNTRPNGKHVVTFENSTTVEADIVVGCDGIKSTMRPYVAGTHQHRHLASANTVTYRGMVSIAALEADGVKTDLKRPLLWVGIDKVLPPICLQVPRLTYAHVALRIISNQSQ
jgi:salicylate hydroxylase